MNDNDIQLIASLIGGELSQVEESIAFTRVNSDPELQAAYDEQLAIASMLRSAPAAAMTADETAALHATLRTELRLDADAPVVAAASSRWSRWWVPLSGLAAAAVVVFAVAVVPNLLEGTDSADLVSAPAAATTVPTSELDTLADDEGQFLQRADSAEESAPTTAAAASEAAGAEESVVEPASEYFLSPAATRQSDLDLPVVEDSTVEGAGLEDALTQASTYSSVDIGALSACFSAGAAGSALSLTGVTPDGSSVYGTATDLETGTETTVKIDIATCSVASID